MEMPTTMERLQAEQELVEKLERLKAEGKRLRFHYLTGEYRDVDPEDWELSGDRVIIRIAGQAPARLKLWMHEDVEVLED